MARLGGITAASLDGQPESLSCVSAACGDRKRASSIPAIRAGPLADAATPLIPQLADDPLDLRGVGEEGVDAASGRSACRAAP